MDGGKRTKAELIYILGVALLKGRNKGWSHWLGVNKLKNWFDNTPKKDNKTLVFVIVFLLVGSNVSKSGVNKLNNWFDNETVE